MTDAAPEILAIDEAVQQAIAACDGDPIAALRSTLIAVAFLEAEVERMSDAVSTGYSSRAAISGRHR